MAFTSCYYISVFLCCCIVAIEEHILVNFPGKGNAEIVQKRTQYHDMIDRIPEMFDRTVLYKREGNGYTQAEQESIVKAHNDFRGNVTPSASNMNEITWSASLAKQAQYWSDECVFDHPNRYQHPDYNGVGQNLFMLYGDKSGKYPPTVTVPTDVWYREERHYDYRRNSCIGRKVCGHYTQVVWAASTEVGCGITFCPTAMSNGNPYNDSWVIACNYSPGGNRVGDKPYVRGDTCSQCPGFCRGGLCSECDSSTLGCDCQIQCQNCGTRDNETCSCTCDDGHYGDSCQTFCEDTYIYCGSAMWPAGFCEYYPFVQKLCPARCNVCTTGPRQTNC